MSFLEEVKNIKRKPNITAINNVKVCIKSAAERGQKEEIFDISLIDSSTLEWLTNEGFDIKKTSDPRDGYFYTVKWG